MTNLIPLDAAIAAIDAELKRYGFGVSGGRCDQMFVVLNAIPTIDPAAIREAALREALKAIADIPHGKNEDVMEGDERSYRAIFALIGEKK